jgi:hypothetical protein
MHRAHGHDCVHHVDDEALRPTLQGRQDLEEIAAYMNGKAVAIDLGIWIFEVREHVWYLLCAQSKDCAQSKVAVHSACQLERVAL